MISTTTSVDDPGLSAYQAEPRAIKLAAPKRWTEWEGGLADMKGSIDCALDLYDEGSVYRAMASQLLAGLRERRDDDKSYNKGIAAQT